MSTVRPLRTPRWPWRLAVRPRDMQAEIRALEAELLAVAQARTHAGPHITDAELAAMLERVRRVLRPW